MFRSCWFADFFISPVNRQPHRSPSWHKEVFAFIVAQFIDNGMSLCHCVRLTYFWVPPTIRPLVRNALCICVLCVLTSMLNVSQQMIVFCLRCLFLCVLNCVGFGWANEKRLDQDVPGIMSAQFKTGLFVFDQLESWALCSNAIRFDWEWYNQCVVQCVCKQWIVRW